MAYFELSTDSEIAAAWYLEVPQTAEPGGNIIGMVFRDSPTHPWKLVVRTRMYLDEKLGRESGDDRRGFKITAKPGDTPDADRAHLLAQAHATMEKLKEMSDGVMTFIDYHRDTDHFLEIWSAQPWAHVTVLPLAQGPERAQ